MASQSFLQNGHVAQNRGSDSHIHTLNKERLHDVQRRLLQHGTTSPLLSQPGRSHKDGSPRFLRRFGILAALTSNEEALSAFLLAWTSYWDVVNARMDPLQSNSSASEPLVRTSKGVVHRSSALCFARLQSWRAPQQSPAIQNERFVGVAAFAKRIEV